MYKKKTDNKDFESQNKTLIEKLYDNSKHLFLIEKNGLTLALDNKVNENIEERNDDATDSRKVKMWKINWIIFSLSNSDLYLKNAHAVFKFIKAKFCLWINLIFKSFKFRQGHYYSQGLQSQLRQKNSDSELVFEEKLFQNVVRKKNRNQVVKSVQIYQIFVKI